MKVGQLELKPQKVAQFIQVGDESGYAFVVTAEYEEAEGSWKATVGLRTYGFVTAGDAVRHLRHAAEHFVRMLSDEPSTAPERDA